MEKELSRRYEEKLAEIRREHNQRISESESLSLLSSRLRLLKSNFPFSLL